MEWNNIHDVPRRTSKTYNIFFPFFFFILYVLKRHKLGRNGGWRDNDEYVEEEETALEEIHRPPRLMAGTHCCWTMDVWMTLAICEWRIGGANNVLEAANDGLRRED
jgi:hypothetical protein